MNWFTREVVEKQSTAAKQKLAGDDTCCTHVEKNIELAYTMHSERDSFGPVSTHVVCKECDKAIEEEEDNKECTCHDCKQTVKNKDGIEWKWYDFYAAQGDEPLFICDACRVKEPHTSRRARDQAAYDDEFGVTRDDEDEPHEEHVPDEEEAEAWAHINDDSYYH